MGLPCGYFKVSRGLLILTLTSFFETLALRFCLLNIVLIICEMLAVWALVTVWFSPVFFFFSSTHLEVLKAQVVLVKVLVGVLCDPSPR